jgi:molybdopterin synthase catalytic subunit
MDWLKTRAPFWKHDGQGWVAAKASDDEATARWTRPD